MWAGEGQCKKRLKTGRVGTKEKSPNVNRKLKKASYEAGRQKT